MVEHGAALGSTIDGGCPCLILLCDTLVPEVSERQECGRIVTQFSEQSSAVLSLLPRRRKEKDYLHHGARYLQRLACRHYRLLPAAENHSWTCSVSSLDSKVGVEHAVAFVSPGFDIAGEDGGREYRGHDCRCRTECQGL